MEKAAGDAEPSSELTKSLVGARSVFGLQLESQPLGCGRHYQRS